MLIVCLFLKVKRILPKWRNTVYLQWKNKTNYNCGTDLKNYTKKNFNSNVVKVYN